jgi:tetratricopeptide (TPR) repeat protein
MAKIWTEENEEFIRENFRHKTYAELADHFGVTQKAMESKIRRMGLKKQDYKDPDPLPAMLPPEPAEPEAPVETGPTPIKTVGELPRHEAPRESEEDRAERLAAELEAAERERERREEQRSDKDLKKAIAAFETGVKKFYDGTLGKALDSFNEVVESGVRDPILVARARQYAEAIERRSRTSSFKPQDADDFYLLGVVRLNDGDPSSALEAFSQALSQAPGDDRIYYCQAAAHAQKGAIEDAIEALREAVDINESNRVYAQNDPDFIPLKVHEDFRAIVRPD